MIQALRSEWVKLRRPQLLLGTYLGLAAVASLFTALVFAQARHSVGPKPRELSLESLAQADGLVHGLSRAAVLLGIVAFGIAAAQIGSDYSLGTLRQLLLRQPDRLRLLGGKYLAVISFLIGATVAAAVLAGATAEIMGMVRGISTSAWTSGAGIRALASALGNVVLAVIGFGTLGLAVGSLVRSSVVSIVAGFVYLLPFENTLAALIHGADHWLPGIELATVAHGGTTSISYLHSVEMGAAYAVVAALVAGVVFRRRDVTA